MQKNIKIRNLDCAACAAELQEELGEIDGVDEVSVDFINQKVTLHSASDEAFQRAIYVISHFEEVEIIDGNAPVRRERHWKEIVSIVISAAFFLAGIVLQYAVDCSKWWSFALYLGAFVAAGWSVVFSVGKNLIKIFRGEFRFGMLLDENLLMLIAAVGAFAVGENMEGAIVLLLYQIGELLQSIAVGSSRNAITKLMELKSDSAQRLEGGEWKEVPPEELVVGDTILVNKGDKTPVDCALCDDAASVDAKSLTGEAYYREVARGGEILAGCINVGGSFRATVTHPYAESAVAKILDLVENSAAKKAAPEKFITKFAHWYTPAVVLLALLLAVIPPLFDGYAFSKWILTALNFLVISCPCALIISVPLTYFSGVGSLARIGVLAKGAVYLDVLAKVHTAVFDKTGTLTEGKFSVSAVNGDKRVLQLAVAAEQRSSHPLAQAFYGIESEFACEKCEEIAGMGLRATVGGKTVLVGSERLLRENGISFEANPSHALIVYVAEEGRFLGSIEIDDQIKQEAAAALESLKKLGVKKTAVLTGDTKERALAALQGLSLDEVHAGLLPEQKLESARAMKQEGVLMYVGDGINDTPVMAESDLAVSMGALGSGAAVEASDLVIATDRLSALPKAMKAAKKTRKIVTENIVGSIAIKVALMALSLAGFIPLWAAVLGDVGVMLLAVLNSMRMRAKIK